jgi:beta-galactosidase
MKNFGPISGKLPVMWHGGDYNPDQWLSEPDVLREDVRLMKLAGCNAMSVGIFAWAALEPEEDRYELDWLADVIDRLYANGVFTILATPSGARPAWLAQKYPEVLRVGQDMRRALFGGRHNHCLTSPVYREKVSRINGALSRRFSGHPGVLLWHVSNEYGGDCHCDLCNEAFRAWLRDRYEGDLSSLNHAWWTSFWSHTFSDWSQIHSPTTIGEGLIHGLNLDWKRFVTRQTVDFIRTEVAAVRGSGARLPVTTNLMGTYDGLDYWRLAQALDVVSWDNYPLWHGAGPGNHPWAKWDPEGRDWRTAADVGFVHDLNRSMKGGRPFLLMESSPSAMNWAPVMKLKRPGMHRAASIQAVAHGADSVLYFQWRKGRGGSEKFHGAVVDHCGHERTRVFREVVETGKLLSLLSGVIGTGVPAEVAVVFDWENRWAIDDAQGPLNDGRKNYERTCKDHYYPFWSMGIPADVIEEDCDFSPYKLVVAPMLYLLKNGVPERLERFVEGGGTLVGTYWSGIVDESDLCFLGGAPGPLRTLFGIWAEEIDALYSVERRSVALNAENPLGMKGSYEARDLCGIIHAEKAEKLAAYGSDFYEGIPALTVNHFGRGSAYYMASRNEERFLSDFYSSLSKRLGLVPALKAPIPEGVCARTRRDEENVFLFLINFKAEPQRVKIDAGDWKDAESGEAAPRPITLAPYGVKILRKRA